MKVTSEEHNNWLGFSLSPHNMKMEVVPSTPHAHPPTSSEQLSGQSSTCFDVGSENNGGFVSSCVPSQLCVMPLKSDGSLCIMEALSRSHPSQAPKSEKFMGGQTMALSLDSIYYNQPAEHETANRHHFDAYFSLFGSQGLYQMTDQQDSLLRNWEHQQHHQHHQHSISNTGLIDQINAGTNGDNNNNGYGRGQGNGNAVTVAGYGDHLQSLSLSMSPGSQSSCVTAPESSYGLMSVETKKRGIDKVCQKQTVHRKSIDTFGKRTSQYRGVTKHRWTGRYEAHLWDNSCKKEGQTRKGRQVYLGGYDMEDKAARAYDLAALKYWGLSTHTNFPMENYKKEMEEMKNMTRQEYVAHLRRKSSGFSRGASMYRGVTRHHQHGRWQARIGRVAGNKDLYLGTFSTQEEAAEAYDVAAIKFRGVNAVTNFDISRYDVDKILASNTLLAGEHARKNKVESIEGANERSIFSADDNVVESISNSTVADNGNVSEWKMMAYHSHDQHQQQQQSYGNPSFSLAIQDLVGLEIASPVPPIDGESAKLGSTHFSNGSSLVTSLNSSREGSPDRNENGNGNGNGNESSFSPMGSKFMGPTSIANTWIPTAQFRPPTTISMAQAYLPLFAAWGET